jgi:hypothetical protein
MKKFYYVVRPQLISVDDNIPECNGWKYVTVFDVVDNVPIEIVNLEVLYSEDSKYNVEVYFGEFMPECIDFELVQL